MSIRIIQLERLFLLTIVASVLACLMFIQNAFSQTVAGTWSKASSNGFTPRQEFGSCVVGNKIYAIGGAQVIENTSKFLSDINIYDPSTDSWFAPEITDSFPLRYAFTCSVVNDKIYIIGGAPSNNGSSITIFDPATNVCSTPIVTGEFTPRYELTSSVFNGKIYVFGGIGEGGKATNILEVFDPESNSWSTPVTTGTFTPRYNLSSSIADGKIYILGGHGDDPGALNTIEVFDPTTNRWSVPLTKGPFTARQSFSTVVLDNKLYVIGGIIDQPQNTMEVLDLATNTWSIPISDGFFTERYGLSSQVVNGKIYAIGGVKHGSLDLNEVFTPESPHVKISPSSNTTASIYPNPSTGISQLTYTVDSKTLVHISIVDILGHETTVVSETQPQGEYSIALPIQTLPSGNYYCNITMNGTSTVLNVAVVK